MADSERKLTKKKSKKRKLRNPEETERPSKTQRIDNSVEGTKPEEVAHARKLEQSELASELQERNTWRRLELIMLIQNKEVDLQKKVESVFDFINKEAKEKGNGPSEDYETVNMSRLIGFLCDWIQSLLISSEKKAKSDGVKSQEKVAEIHLDYRCWEIFKFCLEESLKFHGSLNISRNLLRAISITAKNALLQLSDSSLSSKELFFIGERLRFYNIMLDCVSLVFTSHGGLSNENLDLWLSTIDSVLELVLKIYNYNLDAGDMGVFAMKFSCLMLEPFAKFLFVHPTRKNGFHDFVDKILESLLHLLGILNHKADESSHGWRRNLLKSIEEVLCHGLFHPVHIDGFLCLNSVGKYVISHDGKVKDSKMSIKSYHRHLFEKLEKIYAEKKVWAMCAIGELFRLLFATIKKQKGSSVFPESTNVLLEQSYSSSLNVETRKSLFDFFVQIMEPLLDLIGNIKVEEGEVGATLLDAHCSLKSINSLLSNFMNEKVYVRTEDISDGGCTNFLKKIYDAILNFSSNLFLLSRHGMEKSANHELIILVSNEILMAVGYFLEIEYEVMGHDLVSLWLLILSFLVIDLSSIDVSGQSSLSLKVSDLGCQLIDLYSQLRQVNNTIFALCKAIRVITISEGDGKMDYTRFMTYFCNEAYGKSVGMLLCSREFKLAIHKSIKSIPEGQASGFIRQLSEDISESLGWMKIRSSRDAGNDFDLMTELLGRGLSEIYVAVLDSLTVTNGNSYQIGSSIEGLVSLLRPYMCSLVGQVPDSATLFLISVAGDRYNSLEFGASSHWAFVFFFRVYMSCRSLFRQAISLMPPESSRNSAAVMGDSLTAYGAREWMQRTNWIDDGYFSWFIQSPASVLSVAQSVSNMYWQVNSEGSYPLIYVLHLMALQRLVDLNRQIKSLEYLKQSNFNMVLIERTDIDVSSVSQKRSKKCGRLISFLRQEAEGLTDFMMGHLKLLAKGQLSISPLEDTDCDDISTKTIHETDSWDFGISSVSKKSFATAFWWIICQNIDIWSPHASKKKLKMFLSCLIHTSGPYVTSNGLEKGIKNNNEVEQLKKVNVQQISSALLRDPTLYEQRFVCRHFASRLCHIMENLVSILSCNLSFSNSDLSLLPDWTEVLSTLDKSMMGTFNSTPILHLCNQKKPSPSFNVGFAACHHLLKVLYWIPKRNSSSRSLSLYITHVLNLERLLIQTLLDPQSTLNLPNKCEHFKLLVSCRKTLKCLITAYCEDMTLKLSEGHFPVLWLLKSLSLVFGFQKVWLEDSGTQVKDLIFSLMDHTSYIILTISKYQFNHSLSSLLNTDNSCKEQYDSDDAHQQNNLNDLDLCLDSSPSSEAWKNFVLVANSLKEQTESLLISLLDCNGRVGFDIDTTLVNKFSSMASCFNGFFWGIASTISDRDSNKRSLRAQLIKLKYETLFQLNICMNKFSELSNRFLHILLDKNNHQSLPKVGSSTDCLGEERKRLHLENTVSVATALNEANSFELQCLKKSYLQGLLKGDHPEVAFSLRHIFISYSAMLRLNLNINGARLSSLVPMLIGISRELLLELVSMEEVPQAFSFVWLDGVLKFLEELGHYFSLTDHLPSNNVYSNLIELHLETIGKCISLHGKRATLVSHETESTTKTLPGFRRFSEASSSSFGAYCLDELKARLRMSFKILIKKASELHFSSAMQAIERALVGAQEGGSAIYKINIGSDNGGKVSSSVAASVDCLDLVLEFISGRKHLGVVKRHIQSLVAGLFSIILHLQSPQIFYGKPINDKGDNDPDPGSVILMCVEVLIRISGKHALFKMDRWNIAQCLRIPEALFQDFFHLKLSESPITSKSSLISDDQLSGPVSSASYSVIDRQFLIDLFAASCRLLHSVLKHHKSECHHCISLLQGSVGALLRSLERVDNDVDCIKDYFTWELEEGIRCACFLRRIYEEVRQQKEVLGRDCSLFLADYIWVYSGFGPLKAGIKREINEALRPGVYALIEACSPDDLQYLHTSFGQGPCRNTLSALQHDYKQNFQYDGKV